MPDKTQEQVRHPAEAANASTNDGNSTVNDSNPLHNSAKDLKEIRMAITSLDNILPKADPET